MKIFVGWSGDASHEIALALRALMDFTDSSIEVFVSSRDLSKGSVWSTELSKALSEAQFGVVVVTPSNVVSPWIHFESGAMFKGLTQSRVVPLTIDVPRNALTDTPLAIFQAVSAERDKIRELFDQIYTALPEGDRTGARRQRFEKGWPDFANALNKAKLAQAAEFGRRRRPTHSVQFATTQQQLKADNGSIYDIVRHARELRVSGGTFKTFSDDARILEALRGLVRSKRVVRLVFLDPADEGVRMLARMRRDYSRATVPKLKAEIEASIDRLQDHLGKQAVARIVRFSGALPRFGMCLSDRAVALTLYSFGHGASSPSLSLRAVDRETRAFCGALKKGFEDAWDSPLMKSLHQVRLGSRA